MLIYPTIKQYPLTGLTGMGGGATSLAQKVAAAGGCSGVHNTPSGAQHFWDWSYSHDDQVGSVDFDSNSSEMKLNSTDAGYGGPPGWGCDGTGRYETKASSAGNTYRTSLGSIPHFAEDEWTFDICAYVHLAPASNPQMLYALNSDGRTYGLVHYWNTNMFADSVKSDFNGRLGENTSMGAGALPTQNKWNVLRFSYSGGVFRNETYSDDGSGGWSQNGSTQTFSKTSGGGPGPNGLGRIWLNGFGTHGAGTYGKDEQYFAWAAFYHDDYADNGTAPYVPS